MTTSDEAQPWEDEGALLSIEDLARWQGITRVASATELAQPDLFETDEEYEAFLAALYASRRAGLA